QPEPLCLVTVRPAPARETARESLGSLSEISVPAILDNASEAVLALDPAGVVTYANPAFGHLLGCAPQEAISKPLVDFVWGGEEIARAVGAFPGKGNSWIEDVTIARADGVELCVSVSARPLRRADGSRMGTLAFLRDVTEQRSKANEVARKNAELESYVHSV